MTGDANASQDKVEKLAGPLLEEYLHIKVIKIIFTNTLARKQIFIRFGLMDFMNAHFRILTLQSKRSQRSLQQIRLHGGFSFPILTTFAMIDPLRFVEAVFNSVIEKNEKARVASGGLMAAMLSRGLLGEVNNLAEIILTLILSCFDTDYLRKSPCRDNSFPPWTAC